MPQKKNWSSDSTLDKQRICVNTQLKSSKKQLKWNVCVPKSNSNDRYAITCDVIAFHLVHFVSIWVINKCQSGIDFFQRALNITPVLWKYWCPVQYFAEKHYDESETLAKCTCSNVNKGMRFASGTIFDTLERQTIWVNKYASTFPMA